MTRFGDVGSPTTVTSLLPHSHFRVLNRAEKSSVLEFEFPDDNTALEAVTLLSRANVLIYSETDLLDRARVVSVLKNSINRVTVAVSHPIDTAGRLLVTTKSAC